MVQGLDSLLLGDPCPRTPLLEDLIGSRHYDAIDDLPPGAAAVPPPDANYSPVGVDDAMTCVLRFRFRLCWTVQIVFLIF